ncbi:MAG: DUF5317 family protein [Candidatus Limnocylindrales bacterium]
MAGLLIGSLLGGRIEGLAEVRIAWPWLIIGVLCVQLVLFSGPVADRIGSLGPPIYVGSTGLVIAAVVRNRAIPGMLVAALGAALNLLAIVANGGYMPASASALAAVGAGPTSGYSNSVILARPALEPLTDVFALPAALPLANVFSLGDVIVGLGVTLVIVVAMRRARRGDHQPSQSAGSNQPG